MRQPHDELRITIGVDTHAEIHVAAALDQDGRLLGTKTVPTTTPGHHDLVSWAASLGVVERAGVEGTGSFGAGLTRHLHRAGINVVEVDRPNRRARRTRGKSDEVDARSRLAPCSPASCGRNRRLPMVTWRVFAWFGSHAAVQ